MLLIPYSTSMLGNSRQTENNYRRPKLPPLSINCDFFNIHDLNSGLKQGDTITIQKKIVKICLCENQAFIPRVYWYVD